MKGRVAALFRKEINDIFLRKSAILFFLLLSGITLYSFYSAVDLYSKASIAAVNNPLYATGFEPVPGIFVPTFGGLFIMLSLFAPFVFIQVISVEKKLGTIPLIAQYPVPFPVVYAAKTFALVLVLILSLLLITPTVVYWRLSGGHVPFYEISLLFLGYFLYGMLIIGISMFSASILDDTASSSVLSIFLITLSWFIDFGKDMNLLSFLGFLSQWTVTERLHIFEQGVLSSSSVLFFLIFTTFFLYSGYVYFDFYRKNASKRLFYGILGLIVGIFLVSHAEYNIDVTESHRNSFSPHVTRFLRSLPPFSIKIYLDPTDSRVKDFESDFLRRLKLIKRGVKVKYAEREELEKDYGFFEYSMNGRTERTYSSSEEEILSVLSLLSGKPLPEEEDNSFFRGYPLVLKPGWERGIVLIYLAIMIFTLFFSRTIKNRRCLCVVL